MYPSSRRLLNFGFTILFLAISPLTVHALPGDGTGKAAISPSRVSTGIPTSWSIEFQGHPDYSYYQVDIWIPDGGSTAGDYLPGSRFTDPQLVNSQEPGYTTVIPGEGVEIRNITHTDLTDDSKITIIFSRFLPGSGFRLIYGDTSFSSQAAAIAFERGIYSFKIKTKVEGGTLTFIESSPTVEIFTPGDTPPEIFHQPPATTYPVNNPITIDAEIRDDYKVVSANIFFRKTGSEIFSSTVLSAQNSIYRGIIPASATSIEGVDYYLWASDGFQNSTHPPGAPSSYHRLSIACYDGSGQTQITPISGEVNCPGTWIITFHSQEDLSGGELAVYFPDGGKKAPGKNWSPPQLSDAYQPGYTTLKISEGVEAGPINREVLSDQTRLSIPLYQMRSGSFLKIIYGDDNFSPQGKVVPRQAGSYSFSVYTRGPNGSLKPVESVPQVEITYGSRPENFSVIINEIMWGSQNGGEWLELYNRGAVTVEVGGWWLKDQSGICGKIPSPRSIPSHGYLVLAAEENFLSRFPGIEIIFLETWPTLNDEGDTIFLLDNASSPALIEQVNYTAKWGGSKLNSLERIDPDRSSLDPVNWTTSVSDRGGTPGKVNSVFGIKRELQICDLDVRPNPFSPDKSGPTKIYYQAPIPSRVSLHIYDLRGRAVRYLLDKVERGGTQEIIWDGRDEKGNLLPPGIYLCYLEVSSLDNIRPQKRIRPIVLAKGGKLSNK